MSKSFESGVKGYVMGYYTVSVPFPVNMKGEPDISCKQCRFYRITSRSCALTDKIVPWGNEYVAPTCPLEPLDEKNIIYIEKEDE